MQQYPPAQRSCGRCDQPAVYRVALAGPSDKPSIVLARRAHYRCIDHFYDVVSPVALERAARSGDLYVVVDAAFTASPVAQSS